jgi:myo-inositol-1(or 4)-monophosphatase
MKKFILRLAKDTGRLLLRYYDKADIKTKSQSYNLVTDADIAAQKFIIREIKKKHPKHEIIAEEKENLGLSKKPTWIIDPLDGTNNFAHKYPHFCVSIAYAENKEIKYGCVYDPIKDEMFYAEKDNPSTLNGKKIAVSKARTIKQSLAVTGFYYERGKMMKENLESIERVFLADVQGIRRTGSAALDICYVASARFDFYWEPKLNVWDYAAAKLILENANGKITDYNRKDLNYDETSIIATNKILHKEVFRLVGKK